MGVDKGGEKRRAGETSGEAKGDNCKITAASFMQWMSSVNASQERSGSQKELPSQGYGGGTLPIYGNWRVAAVVTL